MLHFELFIFNEKLFILVFELTILSEERLD